jgi:hypothetical protein
MAMVVPLPTDMGEAPIISRQETPTIGRVDIHQIEIKYLADADRLQMQVRTRAGELVSIWFTRRLMLRLWTPLQQLAARLAVARTAPGAVAVPEAREMLAQAARKRVLENTDFSTPFDRSRPAPPGRRAAAGGPGRRLRC